MGSSLSSIPYITIRRTLIFNIPPTLQVAQQLLESAEIVDNYLQKITRSSSNTAARQQYNYSPAELSLTARNVIQSSLDSMCVKIPKRLLLDLKSVNVVVLNETAESGMPHTRPPNIICVPPVLPNIQTIIHELWHIHQRLYKNQWNTFYREQWSFESWRGILPKKLERQRRLNPDTVDSPLWIWNSIWVPVPIMVDLSYPELGKIDVWFFNANTGTYLHDIPDDMLLFFSMHNGGGKGAYEHPRELSAYMLSELNTVAYTPSFAYKKLVQYFGEIAVFK